MGFQLEQSTIGELLREMSTGVIQLPDFQRQYKWDDERITDLLLTVVRGHPMGVIMFLETGGDNFRFKPKLITGARPDTACEPAKLLLDGQQRLTSLFQAMTGDGIVDTLDNRGQRITRRYFLDILAAIHSPDHFRNVVKSLPGDGVVRHAFGRGQQYEVATREGQFDAALMPISAVFGPGGAGSWLNKWARSAGNDHADERFDIVDQLIDILATPITEYVIPAIRLDRGTTKEAVATVFEKVNTGGLSLDVFELLTAVFAGDATYYRDHDTDFRLIDDWALTQQVIDAHPVLAELRRTDLLQAVTLLATLEAKRSHDGPGRAPAVSARREEILGLDLKSYLRWAPELRDALAWVASFLRGQHIYSAQLVPYRSQLVPLAVIRVIVGRQIDKHAVHERIRQWFWCGVFGELYSGSTETRFARDVEQVPAWAVLPLARHAEVGGPPSTPDTVTGRSFSRSRLLTLRSRQSAAYRGVFALLMGAGARDWAEQKEIDDASYAAMQIDIRHVFSASWGAANGVDRGRISSVVNKTPLSRWTSSIMGNAAPSSYLATIEVETGLAREQLDLLVRGHAIDPATLRADRFDAFFDARQDALIHLIERATGKGVVREEVPRPDADPFESDVDDDADG